MYRLNTKISLTMLCLSGFEVYPRWVRGASDSAFHTVDSGLCNIFNPKRTKESELR